ncbi:hypothetical protein BDZ45DRAFT_745039 [Acephala macrosclerotiorum]|nr:hypothetical protein BDZ45DRAFT_745039 [Acephala macrosclerotiorum]
MSKLLPLERDLERWKVAFLMETLNPIVNGTRLKTWLSTMDASQLSRHSSSATMYDDGVSSLWDSGGDIIFRELADTKPCLFLTCRSQFNAQSSAFKSSNKANEILHYWPTPAPSPPITVPSDPSALSSVFNTLWSPSAYARFYTVNARDRCGVVGGNIYWNLWGGLNQKKLLTSTIPTNPNSVGGGWSVLNVSDLENQPCSCIQDCPYDPVLLQTLHNICTPQLSLPSKWLKIGIFDPPSALQPGATLITITLTAISTTPSSDTGGTGTAMTTAILANANSTEYTCSRSRFSNSHYSNNNRKTITSSVKPVIIITVITSGTGVITSVFTSNPSQTPVTITTVFASGTDVIASVFTSNPSPASLPPAGPVIISETSLSNPTITADSRGNIVIGTQTITAGAPAVTISGSVISLSPGTTEIVLGTQILVVGSPAVTISGTVYALGPGGMSVVVGTSTANLGSIIMSIFGATPSAPAQFTGAAVRIFRVSVMEIVCVWLLFQC